MSIKNYGETKSKVGSAIHNALLFLLHQQAINNPDTKREVHTHTQTLLEELAELGVEAVQIAEIIHPATTEDPAPDPAPAPAAKVPRSQAVPPQSRRFKRST